jgi:hypothetical protein
MLYWARIPIHKLEANYECLIGADRFLHGAEGTICLTSYICNTVHCLEFSPKYQRKQFLEKDLVLSSCIWKCTAKGILSQSQTAPQRSRKLRLPELLENRHMKVTRLSALRTGQFYPPPPPRIYLWYSYLLENESTPGTQCGRKN